MKLRRALCAGLAFLQAVPSACASTSIHSGLSIRTPPNSQSDFTFSEFITYDASSLLIRTERLFVSSGEFHPFRLPSPALYLDVFQKIKAMGFNCVSFYLYWGLLEGKQGRIITDGIWDPQLFIDAAAEAGVYLLARPGPYINGTRGVRLEVPGRLVLTWHSTAETAYGGLPGWTARFNCTLRSNCTEYTDAVDSYLTNVGKIITDAQITNGGPVILVQPENEWVSLPFAFLFFSYPTFRVYSSSTHFIASPDLSILQTPDTPRGQTRPSPSFPSPSTAHTWPRSSRACATRASSCRSS